MDAFPKNCEGLNPLCLGYIQETRMAIEDTRDKINTVSTSLTLLNSEVGHIKSELHHVKTVVENGSASHGNRLITLEELSRNSEKILASLNAEKLEKKHDFRKLILAVVTSLIITMVVGAYGYIQTINVAYERLSIKDEIRSALNESANEQKEN